MKKHVTAEKSHGRHERREYYFIEADAEEPILKRWPGLRSIGMIYRSRENADGETHDETLFAISSHEPKVKMPAKHLRGHWGIENRQPWIWM